MFKLQSLPFSYDALSPHMSKETLIYHHTKHHQTYVDNLNKLLTKDHEGMSLIKIIKQACKSKDTAVFNNAAQVYNHDFFWMCLSPHPKDHKPNDTLLMLLTKDFESLSHFKEKFKEAALTQFGSGWAWLVYCLNDKKLKIIKTGNADTPITDDHMVPLLTCDVWEHAYYVDYPAQRAAFLDVFLNHLINYSFVSDNLLTYDL
jgi:Fe-Mn family superoxide dismutase